MDKIWAMPNLEEAFKAVKRNRGAPGVDNVTIKDYESKLEDNLRVLQTALRSKSYTPKPVRRKYIQKEDGSKRPLGIPTVGDRVAQAALKRVLEPIFEQKFCERSYGFRPGRSAHMALETIRADLMAGYRYVIDADLKSYFDMIPHERLLEQVREEIVDGSVLWMIESFLKAGVLEDGVVQASDLGSPQGGVCSPLLANIYLHPLDERMEARGHRMTRYADDFVICCRSRKGAERVLGHITKLLETELGLKVHPTKTKIVNHQEESFVFLGHEFTPGHRMRPAIKAMKKFKERTKEITRRNQTVNIELLIKKKLNPYLRGWGNYFGSGDVKGSFRALDQWIRRRLRMVQMRSWRKARKMLREMRRRGWRGELPTIRMTAWRNSNCQHAHYAMPNQWFKELGLCSLADLYDEQHPQRG
ncbi:group II intron reverse transcriptase/maturase [Paenibacillus sp. IB182496]|uniref:Group II intron reverse transcriptase/maturase n=2 Tax=Paenibacillus sabuli TaxID=2772509 RepID=A0A927BRA6_9BACL|nr:group II intron reverse transcriptase/maturase [Paenibacillus sabuli]